MWQGTEDMKHEEYERPDLLGHGLSEPDPMPDLDHKIKAGARLAHRGLGHPSNETFIRMWLYYLCYCEGGFMERVIHTAQFLLAKPQFRDLPVITVANRP